MNERWQSTATGLTIAKALKGRRAGAGWVAPCPAHEDHNPSFSISEKDGRVLFKCHAGCSQADVIAALTSLGLWGKPADDFKPFLRQPAGPKPIDERDGYKAALRLWDKALPASGTLVETYLRERGIKVRLSDELRFSPSLLHREAKANFPVMLARISDSAGFCAIQRTFLRHDGRGKAGAMPPKKGLGAQGLGCVRLKPVMSDVLGLAEGIETALSASQIYTMPVWAVLSATRLRVIDIPAEVRYLHIFGDPGDAGVNEAFKAADHYEAQGRHVEIYFPEAHFQAGKNADFNDVVRGCVSRI